MTTNAPLFHITWYHKDELKVVAVFIILVWFFSRSAILSSLVLSFIGVSLIVLYTFRFTRVLVHVRKGFPLADRWLQHVEPRLILTSPDRSRIAMTVLSCVVLGVLCIHRVSLALSNTAVESPTDIYWILFLAWYWVVWTLMLGYFIFRWWRARKQSGEARDLFLEGLVASMFFYHGIPTKQRIITFTAGFLLGGVPTYFATNLEPGTAHSYATACALVIPVMVLTLGGAWYATRWHAQ